VIFYVSNYQLDEIIQEIIAENNLTLLHKMNAERINFEHFVKQQSNILESSSIFIIDTSCVQNTNEEIVTALSNVRMLYGKCRIVVIVKDTSNSSLLSNIVNLGIYDIVLEKDEQSIDEDLIDKAQLKQRLKKAVMTGYSYADSIKYQSLESPTGVKERIIKKEVIKQQVDKAMIGFMGMQSRIGTTHNVIASSFFLKNQGYKVAAVECNLVKEKVFDTIKDYTNGVIEKDGFYELLGVDFYSNYVLEEIHKVLVKNYNFVIIDFGEFSAEKLHEFNRCVMPIVVAGSKAWEMQNMLPLFEVVPEEDLKLYTYLFSFTDNETAKEVIENMEQLNRIYFAEHIPKLFEVPDSITYQKMFSMYVKNDKSSRGKVYDKIIDFVKKKK